MCYDFDAYLAKARIAEQMRKRKPAAEQPEKQSGVNAPAAPREPEPETRDKGREPVPA